MKFLSRGLFRWINITIALSLVGGAGVLSALPGRSRADSGDTSVHGALHIKPQADSLSVSPVLDTDNAVTQTIGTDGGLITATGRDGAKFTLYIPQDALVSDAVIKMTPVSSFGGDPFSGGLAGAVQIEPQELLLFKLATLVVQPVSSVTPGAAAPFAWSTDGADFRLFPLYLPNLIDRDNAAGVQPALDRSALVFKVLHFGSYGVERGTDRERAGVAQHPPSADDALFESQSEVILGPHRVKQLSGTALGSSDAVGLSFSHPAAADDISDYIDVLETAFNDDVKPAMDNALASGDEIQLVCALQKALSWERQVELFGFDEIKFFVKAEKKVTKFLLKCFPLVFKKSFDRCVNEHKPEEVMLMLGLIRQMELWGIDHSAEDSEVTKCATLELDFDSNIQVTGKSGAIDMLVNAKVPLTNVLSQRLDNAGSAPLTYQKITFTVSPPCSGSATAQGDETVVLRINMDLNPRRLDCKAPKLDSSSRVTSMLLDPGKPSETVFAICSGVSEPINGPFWWTAFAIAHQSEVVGNLAGPIYTISDWQPGEPGSPLIARRTYTQEIVNGDITIREVTTLNLFHRPQ